MTKANRILYAVIEYWEEQPYGLIFKMYETPEEAKETIENMKKWDKKFGVKYRKYTIEEYVMT